MTQAELKAILSYEPETGNFRWLNPWKHALKGQIAGSINAHGYRVIYAGGKWRYAHRLAFLFMTGKYPEQQVDHRDRDKANNRWENLRAATMSQNRANVEVRKHNIYGIKGIHFSQKLQKWTARITVNGKGANLGVFKTPEEAHDAYAAAAKSAFGEFANVQG